MPWASSRSSAVACSAWSSASASRRRQPRRSFCERAARELQRDDRVDQPLLRAVVQIADHPPALVVGRRHDPRPRRRQLRPRLGVRDRRRDQLGEARRAATRCPPAAARPAATSTTMTPQRRPSTTIGAPTAERPPSCARRPRPLRWPPRSRCGPAALFRAPARRCLSPQGQTGADREGGAGLAPLRDHGDRRVGLVADHSRVVDAEEPCHLLGDRGEDLRRRRLVRDERRHAPQRGLLLREATRLGPRLGVRDRRRHQLGELGQPRLGVLWERLLPGRGGDRHAPHAAVDHDRDAHRGPDRELPRLLDERSVERQLHRPEPHCAPAVPHRPQLVVHGPTSADRKVGVRGAPGEPWTMSCGRCATTGARCGSGRWSCRSMDRSSRRRGSSIRPEPRARLVVEFPQIRVGRAAVEQRRHVARHDELRVGERVHQKHFVARRERHTKVEHRRLHCRSWLRTSFCERLAASRRARRSSNASSTNRDGAFAVMTDRDLLSDTGSSSIGSRCALGSSLARSRAMGCPLLR